MSTALPLGGCAHADHTPPMQMRGAWVTRPLLGGRVTILAALAIVLIACEPSQVINTESPTAALPSSSGAHANCPPPHLAPDLEAAIPATVQGLNGCRISVGDIADIDTLAERLDVGALWFGGLADITGAQLADVAIAMTGQPDALGLSVTRINGIPGTELWEAFRTLAGTGRIQQVGGRELFFTTSPGEAFEDGAAWIDGDVLYEVRGWQDHEQLAEIVQAAADR